MRVDTSIKGNREVVISILVQHAQPVDRPPTSRQNEPNMPVVLRLSKRNFVQIMVRGIRRKNNRGNEVLANNWLSDISLRQISRRGNPKNQGGSCPRRELRRLPRLLDRGVSRFPTVRRFNSADFIVMREVATRNLNLSTSTVTGRKSSTASRPSPGEISDGRRLFGPIGGIGLTVWVSPATLPADGLVRRSVF